MKNIALKSALALVICACTVSWAQIPTIKITTQNNQEVKPTCSGTEFGGMCMGTTTIKYIKITRFELTGAGKYDTTLTPEPQGEADSIRVRGNSTAGIADKRPYRIKFDKKQGLFGKTKAKSWVLLANYYDPTFTLNAIAFRLGQKMGIEFTHTSEFVNVEINGSYKGIYQLTEQTQVNPGRVDIDTAKGFLVEFDYHDPESDEVKFTSARYNLPVFIKSPEIESNFNVNNTKVKWVKDTIDALTNKMYESGFPENGYRNMVDLESFAKYTLIQLLLDNYDFNNKTPVGQSMTGQDVFGLPGSNFAYKDARQKIKAGPLWDFDLAAGVTHAGFPAHYNSAQDSIRPRNTFYRRFFEDKVFLAKWKKAWDNHQSDFTAIPAFIDSIADVLRGSVANNKYANQSGGMSGGSSTLNTNTYNSEVTKLKTWWNSRMTYFGQEINKMNIDVSKDIEDKPASIAARAKFANSKKIAAVKNGVNLNAENKASVEILSLNGSVIRKSKYAGGNHTVRLGNLPKGLYMVKVSVDGDKQVLRVPVR